MGINMQIIRIVGWVIFSVLIVLILGVALTPEKIRDEVINKIKLYAEKHKKVAEVVRFVIIGGLATVIDFFITGLTEYFIDTSKFSSLLEVFIGGNAELSTSTVVIGNAVGFTTSLIFNYVFSIIFVYEHTGNSKSVKGFVLFAVLSIIGLALNLLGVYVLFDLLHTNQWLAKVIMTIIVLIYNYLSRKYFIFNKNLGNNK